MNGLLCVNKPSGLTSRDVVNQVQRRLKPTKVGHAGTLDPLATGVLVLMIGKATRLTEYVQRMPKSYIGEFRLGQSSDTEDVEGRITELTDPPRIERAQIESILPGFVGKIDQVPPAYSALKVKGKRAYSLARAGEKVELKARSVEIYSIELDSYDYPHMRLLIRCGSGTYIRSLGRDIARAVGTEAIMTGLERTAIGTFSIDTTIGFECLAEIDLGASLLPMDKAVTEIPVVTVTPQEVERLQNGMTIDLSALSEAGSSQAGNDSPEVGALAPDGSLAAILVRRRGKWGPTKSFVSG